MHPRTLNGVEKGEAAEPRRLAVEAVHQQEAAEPPPLAEVVPQQVAAQPRLLAVEVVRQQGAAQPQLPAEVAHQRAVVVPVRPQPEAAVVSPLRAVAVRKQVVAATRTEMPGIEETSKSMSAVLPLAGDTTAACGTGEAALLARAMVRVRRWPLLA